MDTKLTFTIYDIVTHIIPGAFVLLFLHYTTGTFAEIPDSLFIFLLIIGGYILGSILSLIGIRLFWVIYPDDFKDRKLHPVILFIESFLKKFPFLKMKQSDTMLKKQLIKAINKKYKVDLSTDRLGLFNFADTIIASTGFTERDMLLAKEGFFRTLTTLSFLTALYLMLFSRLDNRYFLSLGFLLITELLRFGREYYRTLKNQQIYTLALIKIKGK